MCIRALLKDKQTFMCGGVLMSMRNALFLSTQCVRIRCHFSCIYVSFVKFLFSLSVCMHELCVCLFWVFLVIFVHLGSQRTVKESCMGLMKFMEESKQHAMKHLRLIRANYGKSYARPCNFGTQPCDLLSANLKLKVNC